MALVHFHLREHIETIRGGDWEYILARISRMTEEEARELYNLIKKAEKQAAEFERHYHGLDNPRRPRPHRKR